MMPHQAPRLGYYTASHWFQGAVFLILVGVLASGLLSALSDAKEQAERQWLELTIRNMRTGMQLAMGEALVQQREGLMASWVGSNPVHWLDSPPPGYRGECTAEESRVLAAGEWCFERELRQLAYRPQHSDRLRTLPEGRECNQLRWQVARTPDAVASGGFVGLRIEVVASCQWPAPGR